MCAMVVCRVFRASAASDVLPARVLNLGLNRLTSMHDSF